MSWPGGGSDGDASSGSQAHPGQTEDPPEGDNGIAAKYPGDKGITGDPAVIFTDDFENYGGGKDLGGNWNAGVYHNAEIQKTAANIFAGGQSVRLTSPRQAAALSHGVARTALPGRDLLFLRWHSKFDPSFDVVGSSHNGGGISAHYFKDGMATRGIPTDGKNKFVIAYDHRSLRPGTAHPQQHEG